MIKERGMGECSLLLLKREKYFRGLDFGGGTCTFTLISDEVLGQISLCIVYFFQMAHIQNINVNSSEIFEE